MIGFVGHLRRNDFRVGPGETLAALDLRAPARGCRSGRGAALAARAADQPAGGMGALRRRCSRPTGSPAAGCASGSRARPMRASDRPGRPRSGRITSARDTSRRGSGDAPVEQAGDDEQAAAGGQGRLVASRQEALRRTDLRHIADPAALAEAERVAYRLARAMRYRLSRRYRIAARGAQLDLRRTIRANLSLGGEPLLLATRARPERPVRLVVLLDVSGSMQPYARGVPAVRQGAGGELGAGRRLSVPYQAGPGQRRAARARRDQGDDPARADDRGLRRRHAARPVPAGVQRSLRQGRAEQPERLHHHQRRLRHRAGRGSWRPSSPGSSAARAG